MSFRVFAYGSPDFHYLDADAIDDSTFDNMKLVSSLSTTSPTVVGAIGAGVDKFAPSAGAGDGVVQIGGINFLHNLIFVVNCLAARPGATDGKIDVVAKKTSILGDTVEHRVYNFSPGDFPGNEFVKKISDALSKTDLNNWGVLRALGTVLGNYNNQLGDDGTPMINITLTK